MFKTEAGVLTTEPCRSFSALHIPSPFAPTSLTFHLQLPPPITTATITSHLSYNLHSLCKQKGSLASFHIVHFICYLHGVVLFALRCVNSNTLVIILSTFFNSSKGILSYYVVLHSQTQNSQRPAGWVLFPPNL